MLTRDGKRTPQYTPPNGVKRSPTQPFYAKQGVGRDGKPVTLTLTLCGVCQAETDLRRRAQVRVGTVKRTSQSADWLRNDDGTVALSDGKPVWVAAESTRSAPILRPMYVCSQCYTTRRSVPIIPTHAPGEQRIKDLLRSDRKDARIAGRIQTRFVTQKGE